MQRPSRTAYRIAFTLVVASALAVRFPYLAAKPFWFDECFSVEVARINWRNFVHLLWWREANMSLYYVLLRIWLHFGESPFFIRSFSVLISAATIPPMYWLVKNLYDRRVALIAAGLMAFNAYDIRYAQEARSYALFVLLATLSSGFLIQFLKNPTSHNKIAYILASAFAVYAHFYALLLVSAQCLAILWFGIPDCTSDRTSITIRQLRRAWFAIGIAVLPLVVFVAKTGAGPIRWIHRPSLSDLFQFLSDFTNGLPLIYAACCLLAIIASGKSLWSRSARPDWTTWRTRFLLVWLVFPVLVTVLLSWARPVFLPRYMIFCLPALLTLVAAGLAGIKPAPLSAALVFLVLVFSALKIPFVYGHDFDSERDASGAAANFILDHSEAGDAILFHIAETRVPYEFFRSLRAGENTARENFSAPIGPEILFPHHGPGLDYHDFTGKPTADFLRAATTSHRRVWVMLMNNGTPSSPDPTTVMLTQLLPGTFPGLQRWRFPKVEVRLYSRSLSN